MRVLNICRKDVSVPVKCFDALKGKLLNLTLKMYIVSLQQNLGINEGKKALIYTNDAYLLYLKAIQHI